MQSKTTRSPLLQQTSSSNDISQVHVVRKTTCTIWRSGAKFCDYGEGQAAHLQRINHTRVLTCQIVECCNLPRQGRSTTTLLTFRMSCKHIPSFPLYQLIAHAYFVFASLMAGTLSMRWALKQQSVIAVLCYQYSTFGYLAEHNFCTTAYQQHLRRCIIATTFSLSSWARTRSAAKTERGKERLPSATTVAPASLRLRRLRTKML
jgi:lipid-A-disaccharide synthase-like uncharacterized protein